MSKANKAEKVLRTALKRLHKGWVKGHWAVKNADGGMSVCLEGALFGFCQLDLEDMTPAQLEARNLVLGVINERFRERGDVWEISIPGFNDNPETTFEEVEEVVKLALIRAETGYDPEDDYLSEEETVELLKE